MPIFFRCDTVSGRFTNDTKRTRKKESFCYYEAICMNNISEPNCFTLRRDRIFFLFFRSFEGTKESALESTSKLFNFPCMPHKKCADKKFPFMKILEFMAGKRNFKFKNNDLTFWESENFCYIIFTTMFLRFQSQRSFSMWKLSHLFSSFIKTRDFPIITISFCH